MENDQLLQQNVNTQLKPIPKWSYILVTIGLATFAGIGGYMLGVLQERAIDSSDTTLRNVTRLESPMASPIPAVTPSPKANSIMIGEKHFSKPTFSSTRNWYDKEPYPTELTRISQDQLVDTWCSPRFLFNESTNGYQGLADEGTEITPDSETFRYMTIIKGALGKPADAVTICETGGGKVIAEYETWAGGGGTGNIAYYGTVEDSVLKPKVSLPNPGWAYFGCDGLLALTTTNQAYVSCAGGDGGSSGSGIYRIDMAQQKMAIVRRCDSTVGEIICK